MAEKTYTVKAKNQSFNGVRCGVRFEDGVAKSVPEAAAVQLVARGYDCPAAAKKLESATEAAHKKAAEKAVAKAKGASASD
jgi:hypothetical protein